jgi:hypothetical protein
MAARLVVLGVFLQKLPPTTMMRQDDANLVSAEKT